MRVREAYLRFQDDLAEALDIEHYGECGATCDIHFAMEKECYLWAAHILTGATDEGIHRTSAILSAIMAWADVSSNDKSWQNALNDERDELCAYDHWTCEACNAVNWTDDYRAPCDACGDDSCDPVDSAWEYALGDVNPWDHTGGYLNTETGVLVHIDPCMEETGSSGDDGDGNPGKRTWYVHALDVNGGVSEIDWADLRAVALTVGWDDAENGTMLAPFETDLDTLMGDEKTRMMMRRAGVLEAIALHYGWSELTAGIEKTLTKRQILSRWSIPE